MCGRLTFDDGPTPVPKHPNLLWASDRPQSQGDVLRELGNNAAAPGRLQTGVAMLAWNRHQHPCEHPK